MRKLLNNLLCFVSILCLALTGCHFEPKLGTVTPGQADETRLTDSLHVERLATAQGPAPKRRPVNAARDSSKDAAVAPNVPIAQRYEKAERASQHQLDIPETRSETVQTSGTTQAHLLEASLAASQGAVSDPEQLSSRTDVNMPVLDKPGMTDELICVNFDHVDIRTVLKTIGDVTGINFVVDESVRGTVTVMSPTEIPLSKIYNFLESILEVTGYAAVPAEGFVKIVPRAKAAGRNLQVYIGTDPSQIPQSDAIITQIMPLNYADAREISEIIKPLLATGSHMATYPRTNSIVITDTSANIHHVAKIIQTLDVSGVEKKVTVIELTYASAQVLSEQISRIMQTGKVTASSPGRSRSISQIETDIKILPDVRTNSLIVVASAQDADTIAKLIGSLDVPRPSRAGNVHVVYLENAPAKETAESLTAVLANMKITGALEAAQEVYVSPDEGTNALIITASAQDFELIAGIIEKLDIVREQVLVEMLIVEVSEDALEQIGIDWTTFDEAVSNSVRVLRSFHVFGETNLLQADSVSRDFDGLSIGVWDNINPGVPLTAIFNALKEISGINILSTPHILTSNHNKAKITVGENIPFVIQSRITEEASTRFATAIKTFEYRDVGIVLDITPHISQSGLIRLEIDSEFTKFIDTGSIDTQRTTKRQAQTNVTMKSGSTVVIGGLIRDDKITVERKIPLVSDIPVIGELFKFRRDRLQKTNLLMFITPHVMASQQDLERMTEEKKEEMRPALEDFEQSKSGN